jgi:hypothetical protein
VKLRGSRVAVAVSDTLSALALVAWVGGHVALGAYAARILFRDLPRALAAETMTKVFRSFDGLITAALVVVFVTGVVRWMAAGMEQRADRIALYATMALVALGLFELAYVHPQIEEMFKAGRTLEPAFASLHKLSARCANLEIGLSATILGAQAWARRVS